MTVDDLIAETDFKFITRLQDAKARAEDYDRHQRAEAGLEVGDGNAHQSVLDTAQDRILKDKKHRDRDSHYRMFLFDIIQQQINDMQRLIDGAEGDFSTQYGEEWREQFAMRILDPDIMPQRQDGESLEDYRARVEKALIDELLNPDGTIKDEYRDHPEYGHLAQWAQWKYDQQQALALSDPSLSDSERAEKVTQFRQSASHDRIEQAIEASAYGNADTTELEAAREQIEDTTLSEKPLTTESGFLP